MSWFDELSKSLSGEWSRRDALRWMGVGTAGAVLTTAGVGTAWADHTCRNILTNVCGGQKTCHPNRGICTCSRRLGKLETVCIDEFSCGSRPTCTSDAFCQANNPLTPFCVESCCDPAGTARCASPCGTKPFAPGTGQGPTAMGG
jgi:hypothetical protein